MLGGWPVLPANCAKHFWEFGPMTLWFKGEHNNPTYVAVTQRVNACSLVFVDAQRALGQLQDG